MTAPQKKRSPAATGQFAEQSNAEAHIAPAPAQNDKRFATLAAKFALAGHGLIRNAPGDGQAAARAACHCCAQGQEGEEGGDHEL